MRQIGYMAACALYALEHHIDRLSEDHEKPLKLPSAFQNYPMSIRWSKRKPIL